jgi:hypothetical protein
MAGLDCLLGNVKYVLMRRILDIGKLARQRESMLHASPYLATLSPLTLPHKATLRHKV